MHPNGGLTATYNEYLNNWNNLVPIVVNTANKAVSSHFNVAEFLSIIIVFSKRRISF